MSAPSILYRATTRESETYVLSPQRRRKLGDFTVLHVFGEDFRGVHRGLDGMCLDTEGNIIACGGWRQAGPGPMVYVFSPSGRVLETHPVPVDWPTNCAFGGRGLDTLYVTTHGGHLFRVSNTGRRGSVLFPH